jgi:calcineurin-like phosphoesterase family protein
MADPKRWITADWHLGEGEDPFRWVIMQRPGFRDQQHMVDELVRLHNELVSPDDEVIFVGDACNLNTPEFLEQIARFNGKKTMLRGNHDRPFTDEQLSPFFDVIVPEGEGLELEVGEDKLPCWATHYPTQSRPDRFNLVGHIHSAWKFQLNAVNVGVDANHFRPHDLDKSIPFFFTAISKFYDRDVWAAYDDAQARFKDERGDKGCYLEKEGLVGGGTGK